MPGYTDRPLADVGGAGGYDQSGDAIGGDAAGNTVGGVDTSRYTTRRKRAQDSGTAGGNAYTGASSNVDGGHAINHSDNEGTVTNGAARKSSHLDCRTSALTMRYRDRWSWWRHLFGRRYWWRRRRLRPWWQRVQRRDRQRCRRQRHQRRRHGRQHCCHHRWRRWLEPEWRRGGW